MCIQICTKEVCKEFLTHQMTINLVVFGAFVEVGICSNHASVIMYNSINSKDAFLLILSISSFSWLVCLFFFLVHSLVILYSSILSLLRLTFFSHCNIVQSLILMTCSLWFSNSDQFISPFRFYTMKLVYVIRFYVMNLVIFSTLFFLAD